MKQRNYFKEALEALTGKKLPMRVPPYAASRMSDDNQLLLQEWCVGNANPPWATGLSIIEAAELIVQSAIDNGNIKGPKRNSRFSEGGILSRRTLDEVGGVLAQIEGGYFPDQRGGIPSLRSVENALVVAKEALVPFARMAEGKDSWEADGGCAEFPKMTVVREARVALQVIKNLG